MSDSRAERRQLLRPRNLLIAAIGVGAVLLAGALLFDVLRPHVFSGAVLQSSEPAPEMTGLEYEDGEEVELSALRGDVILIYFGYTHCPDLCPTMLSTVDKALSGLGEADRVHTMMITVDPGRDTPQLLGEYVSHFNEEFRGVWGEEEAVRSVASRYGVHFEYEDPTGEGNYLVGHTASLMLIDPEGVLRVVYPVGTEADDLREDLEELLA